MPLAKKIGLPGRQDRKMEWYAGQCGGRNGKCSEFEAFGRLARPVNPIIAAT
jgi:hypothetical protein